jgi:hypothetical protein
MLVDVTVGELLMKAPVWLTLRAMAMTWTS